MAGLCRELRARTYGCTRAVLGDNTLSPHLLHLHGDDDLLSRVGLDQVVVRLAHALGLAQLPPGWLGAGIGVGAGVGKEVKEVRVG